MSVATAIEGNNIIIINVIVIAIRVIVKCDSCYEESNEIFHFNEVVSVNFKFRRLN
jgi:hypothetical protein